MDNSSEKPVVCPECRQLSIFKDDGKYNYTFKAFPANTEDFKSEFTHDDKILISEYHGNHYFVILLDKESADDNIEIEGKVASTFNLHVKTIVKKIVEKASKPEKHRILVLSDHSVWGQLVNIVYASLLQIDEVRHNNSNLSTSSLQSKLNFGNLIINHNTETDDTQKYNAVIVDQKVLLSDGNVGDMVEKLLELGSFVVTVNSKVEDPIPKISMREFNEKLRSSKLNFLFVDVQDIQQAAILLTQVLQK